MQSSQLPPLNTKLPFPNSTSTDYAILKYVGSVNGHNGVFCGIQLFGELSKKGKNNGIINGIKYFDIDDDVYRNGGDDRCGLFVPLRKVLDWLNHTNNMITPASPRKLDVYQKPDDVVSTVSNTMSIDSPTNIVPTSASTTHIKQLEAQLQQRTLDLQDLYNQINELDVLLKDNERKLTRKEEKFNNYKIEKGNEIELLVGTIESLEKRIAELSSTKETDIEISKIMNENSELKKDISEKQLRLTSVTENNKLLTANVSTLENDLAKERENFQSLKISKDSEINRLRNIEMEKYKLDLKIEELNNIIEKNSNVSDVILEKDRQLNDSINQINELKLKIQELEKKNDDTTTTASTPTINNKNELDIYIPKTPIDSTAGRANFCTFCDINGHSKSECPYEKDDIEMF